VRHYGYNIGHVKLYIKMNTLGPLLFIAASVSCGVMLP